MTQCALACDTDDLLEHGDVLRLLGVSTERAAALLDRDGGLPAFYSRSAVLRALAMMEQQRRPA